MTLYAQEPNIESTTLADAAGINIATVSAAGALKIDGSAVTQPISAGVSTQATAAWTNATPLNTAISVTTLSYPTLLISFNNTTGNGSITLEGSIDGGGTYPNAINAMYPSPFISTVLTSYGVINMAGIPFTGGQIPTNMVANVAGYTYVRVRLTAQPAGGTINVGLQAINTTPSAAIAGAVYVLNPQPLSISVDGSNGTGIPVTNASFANQLLAQVSNPTAASLLAQVSQPTAASLNATVRNQGAAGATLDSTIGAATAPANAFAVSHVCQTTAPSLTAGQAAAQQCDYQGSHFVKPYRRGQTNSQATTITNSSAATTAITAPAAGIFADISSVIITSTAQTTGVAFTATLSDGTKSYIYDLNTGSTTVLSIAPQLHLTFNPPLPASTAATAWTITLSSNAVTVHITMGYVLQKAS